MRRHGHKRHRSLLTGQCRSGRRLGVLAAILGLLVQLALPFTPMPASMVPVPETRQEAIALWGPDSLCSAQDRPEQNGHRRDGSLHCDQCPICQAQHQLAQLLPPLPGGLAPPRAEPAGRLQPSELIGWSDGSVVHHRSRAPPVALS